MPEITARNIAFAALVIATVAAVLAPWCCSPGRTTTRRS